MPDKLGEWNNEINKKASSKSFLANFIEKVYWNTDDIIAYSKARKVSKSTWDKEVLEKKEKPIFEVEWETDFRKINSKLRDYNGIPVYWYLKNKRWNKQYFYTDKDGKLVFLEVKWEKEFKNILVEKYYDKTWEPIYWYVVLLNWKKVSFGNRPNFITKAIRNFFRNMVKL